MNLFDRYIIQRILVGTFFGTVCLSSIFTMGQVIKELQTLLVGQELTGLEVLRQIFQFLLSSAPLIMTYTLPWAFLTAVILAMGKMSTANEIVSMRMAGWGYWRIALPIIAMGLVLSGLTYWINGTVAPRSKTDITNLLMDAVKKDPKSFLKPGVIQKRLGTDNSLFIEDKEGDTLKGFHFYQFSTEQDFPTSYVYAKEVDLNVPEGKNVLELSLRKAYYENLENNSPIIFADQAQPWLINIPGQSKSKRPSAMTNSELATVLNEKKDTLSEKEFLKRVTELESRRAIAFSCLCFGLLGVPLGVQSRRKSSNKGFGIALLVAAAYFGTSMGFEGLGETAQSRRLILWVPNLVCLFLALLFYRKVNYS